MYRFVWRWRWPVCSGPERNYDAGGAFRVRARRRWQVRDVGSGGRYYEKLAKESDRIDLQVLGKSTQGRPFLMLTISSPQNLAKADRYKEISRQMADPRGLTPQQIDALSAEGRAVVLVTLGQHSTEVASSQMGPRLVYRLATSNDDQTRDDSRQHDLPADPELQSRRPRHRR